MPGPGSYASEVRRRKTIKTAKGPVTGFGSNSSSAFRSTTCRSLQSDLNRQTKLNVPATGHYEEKRTIGYQAVQGGVPNNFLLTKNNRDAAPFNTSDSRLN
jgi:hypothetical protein